MEQVKLINAYDLLKRLSINPDGKRIPETDCDGFPVTISLREIKKMIIGQPVAYDVDGVIKDLSSEKEDELIGMYNSELERTIAEKRMEWRNEVIDVCIEIVKRG